MSTSNAAAQLLPPCVALCVVLRVGLVDGLGISGWGLDHRATCNTNADIVDIGSLIGVRGETWRGTSSRSPGANQGSSGLP